MFVLRVPASQTSNAVSITTNLVFYLKTLGTSVDPESQFKSDQVINYTIRGTSTNEIYYRHFPFGNFDCHLFKEDGSEVPKTKTGLDFSRTPSKPTKEELESTRQFYPYSVNNTSSEYRPLFRVDDMFTITNKGIYELEVRARLCVIMTNNMPDLNAMIDARNVTGRSYSFANDFGILTSPPLRVKVVKE